MPPSPETRPAKADTIVLVGVNHKTAPVEVREQLALKGCETPPLHLFHGIDGCQEALFLSTCNRVEVVAVANDGDGVVDTILETWLFKSGLDSEVKKHLYVHRGEAAIRHIFRVASSLDSMVVGEPQILGQLKEAYRLAVEERTTGTVLNRLLERAFTIAKRIRTQTEIASHAVSISYAAVELARKIFGELRGKAVLLIGAGEMAELAAQHLITNGVSRIVVANRTLSRAVELAKEFHGEAISLDELQQALEEVDIVISSTGAPGVVLTKEQVKRAMGPRYHRLLFLIDIAVPRDIERSVDDVENVYLYDIDDLKSVVEENTAKREREARKAERIIDEEVIKFLSWLETLEVVPVIQGLQAKGEAIRQRELARSMKALKGLSAKEMKAVETLTRSIVQKILHDPVVTLRKECTNQEAQLLLDTVKRLFKL